VSRHSPDRIRRAARARAPLLRAPPHLDCRASKSTPERSPERSRSRQPAEPLALERHELFSSRVIDRDRVAAKRTHVDVVPAGIHPLQPGQSARKLGLFPAAVHHLAGFGISAPEFEFPAADRFELAAGGKPRAVKPGTQV